MLYPKPGADDFDGWGLRREEVALVKEVRNESSAGRRLADTQRSGGKVK